MATVETVDVTPIFNYTREIEIVKRFAERLSALSEAIANASTDPSSDEPFETLAAMADFVRPALPHVRQAISELMADDIKHQILDGTFPLRFPAIDFHEFQPEGQINDATSPPHCMYEECWALEDTVAHALA